jgi:hypothetical protein
MLDYDTFIEDFEEFSDVSENLINILIETSEFYFNDTIWGTKINFVRSLLVAHFLQLKEILLANQNNTIQAIDVKDELMVRFYQVTLDDNEYKNTYYGRILQKLIKQKGYQFSTVIRPKGILSNAK